MGGEFQIQERESQQDNSKKHDHPKSSSITITLIKIRMGRNKLTIRTFNIIISKYLNTLWISVNKMCSKKQMQWI